MERERKAGQEEIESSSNAQRTLSHTRAPHKNKNGDQATKEERTDTEWSKTKRERDKKEQEKNR